MRFIAVGDALVDVVCDRRPEPNQRRHGKVVLRAGGSAVNAAIAAAGLGVEASVIARVGRDLAGDLVVKAVEASGVAARVARDPQLHTGVAVAFADAVVADRGANARFSPDDVPETLDADALFVSGFAAFQQGSRGGADAALARFNGPWAAVDLSSPKLAAEADLGAVRANVIFATEEEARAAVGLDRGRFEILCVKREGGATAYRGGERVDVPVARAPQTSPFGAGDAFAAAFLVALTLGRTLAAALAEACEAGARAVGAR